MEKFPFEIHQTGWGEFDIGIKIFFVDPAERPAEVIHGLKLHPEQNQQASMKKPVVSERYDEIVFVEPTESFAYILDKGTKVIGAASAMPGGVIGANAGYEEMKEDNENTE